MTQEFKSIEEIKEEYAKEISGLSWEVMIMRQGKTTNGNLREVAQRHAQQYVDANKELSYWKESMMKVHSELDLQEIGKVLEIPLGSSIAPQVLPKVKELQEQNKELVEMLKHLYELTEYLDEWIEEREKMHRLLAKNQM